MKPTDKVTDLVEQAAGKIPLIDPGDTDQLQEISRLFQEIESALKDLEETGQSSGTQLQTLTKNGAEQIEKLMQENGTASSQLLEELSQSVSDLQALAETLHEVQGPQSEVQEKTEENKPDTEEVTVIPEEDVPLVQDFIAESREHIETSENALLDLENQPDNEETLNRIFRGFHTIKGMAGFLNLTAINRLAHVSENLLDQARKGKLRMVGANSDLAFTAIDMLKTMLRDLEEAVSKNSPLRMSTGSLQTLIDQIQLGADGKGQAEPIPPKMDTAQDDQLEPLLESVPKAPPAGNENTASAQEKIKVSTKRLDELINMTGELSVAQLMISEEVGKTCHSDSDLFRKVALQSKIVRELQELSMAMRMIPVKGAFQKMARLVRDLSRKAGKDINFQTFGEETELDRTIVDKITDPLIHMMRNSIDHGLEPSEERTKKGKSAQGLIRLSASHEAGSILIEIEDDGRGLNREKILKKAIEKGLITDSQDLTEEEIYALIFRPGFSTADKITDVSGRGVGMDVVSKNIESLNGKIQIRSTPDKGTTFLIHLPLTLAIIDGQIVTLGNQRYIIPIHSVVQSLRPSPEQISTIQNRSQVVMIRGQLHPLIRLHKLFSVSGAVEDPSEALLVVVGEGSRKCCLQVDDLLGQQQVVIKSLQGLGKIKGVSGGAIMGDGQISLILDIPGLIDLARHQSGLS